MPWKTNSKEEQRFDLVRQMMAGFVSVIKLCRRLGVWRPAVRVARHCHEVWTVDFKGWYRTAAGVRVEPLTVRDLYSRYGLRVGLLRSTSLACTRPEFAKLFAEHGLPERIRCDNGTP